MAGFEFISLAYVEHGACEIPGVDEVDARSRVTSGAPRLEAARELPGELLEPDVEALAYELVAILVVATPRRYPRSRTARSMKPSSNR